MNTRHLEIARLAVALMTAQQPPVLPRADSTRAQMYRVSRINGSE